MICVTGMNKIGTYNSEYNYGNTIVDVAAPCRSVNICSPSDIITNKDDGMTSCAAPIVTGIAALLKSYYPSATTEMIKHAILFSVQKGSTFSGKVRMGGYVNAESALQLLETQMPLKPNPATPFFIRNKETGQYLTMQSDKSITQTDFTGSSNQKWILSNYNNGYYVIQSYQNQTYRMDVDNASSANGTIVKAHVYTGYDDAQSFRFQQTTDGNYYIYPKVADGVGRCLQINGTDKLRIYNNNALTTQQWCLQSSSFFDSSQTYYLRNKYTGRYLTVTELESGGYSLGLSSYLGDYTSKSWKFTTDGTTPYKQISSTLNTTLLLGFNTNDTHSVSSNFFYHYANVGNSLEYNDLQLIPQSDGAYKIATEDSIPYQIYNTELKQYVTCTAQRYLIDFNGTPGFSINTNITPDSDVWILEDASVIDEIESRQYYIVNHCNMKAFSYVTPIQLTNYKDTNYYRFTFEYRGNDNYRIHDAVSGQYLVAYNASNKIALSLTYSNTDANTWKFQVMENGLFTIVNSADSTKGMRIQTISDTNISYSELAPAYEQDAKQHWSIFYELSE